MPTGLRASIQLNQADLANLKKKIKQLQDFSQKEVNLSLNHAGKSTVGRMKRMAPVDTGRLRREIEYTATSKDLIIESTGIDPDTQQDYAALQNYGTRFYPGTQYFNRGIKWMIQFLTKDLSRKLRHIARN